MQLYDRAMAAAACDSLQRYQEKVIQRSLVIEHAKDSTITELNGQIIWTKASLGESNTIINNEKALTTIQKKKKRRWIGAFFIITGMWIGSEVLEAKLNN